jgi:hypothetical protein
MLGGGWAGLNKVRMTPEQMTAMGRPAADPAPAAQSLADRMAAAQMASTNMPVGDGSGFATITPSMGAAMERARLKRNADMGIGADGQRIIRSAVMREPSVTSNKMNPGRVNPADYAPKLRRM